MSDGQHKNVYAPPKADLELPRERGAENLDFPRFSTWGVFALAVLTLSFYLIYWLYSRTKIMNHVLPEKNISMSKLPMMTSKRLSATQPSPWGMGSVKISPILFM